MRVAAGRVASDLSEERNGLVVRERQIGRFDQRQRPARNETDEAGGTNGPGDDDATVGGQQRGELGHHPVDLAVGGEVVVVDDDGQRTGFDISSSWSAAPSTMRGGATSMPSVVATMSTTSPK